ncbi:MAG: indole-3-glycerol-phosphate synthase [Opitutales bacterium]|jgi:indole-3-glycerol phosphate synthase|nr:indole-3-glycerol-phosphate synthase [Opitutales bacterium]MBT5167065.1 indole-3-glycerol-phosphate synthase [Opitutales bacterium]MBT5814327.1 indole-3-glycerol-phosphate synthase [Opitutales bacterium]MBT7865116.1 indole-3-glycerol-phosphate synthase [Opitutales bacterium]MDG2254444.1 indole-3-glycerol phosphate synthase TrpC [Opitutaceae bacterium]
MDKLSEIMDWKRREIAERIRVVHDSELAPFGTSLPQGRFLQALQAPSGLAVISEIKRRSPSAGQIKALGPSTEQADTYLASGADCLSILTDQKYFGGELADLESVTQKFTEENRGIPCLRKDFMVHPIQVLEAAQAGASAILIIVRALSDDEMKSLRAAADLAGLDALYEIHSEPELGRAVAHDARIIGVNNRDLAIFKTDLAFSERLIPLFPQDVIAVSESGIWNGKDARRVRAAGAKAILVGEALMKADSTSDLISDFHQA